MCTLVNGKCDIKHLQKRVTSVNEAQTVKFYDRVFKSNHFEKKKSNQ